MAHNPEDSAGAQLAIIVAVKLLLSQFKDHPGHAVILEGELERMGASILASGSTDRKLEAFQATAEALMAAIKPAPTL